MPGGGSQTTQQTQDSSSAPWKAAQPLLESLLGSYGGQSTAVTGAQSSALNNLQQSASGLPNFGAESASGLSKIFGADTSPQVGMLSDAYKTLQGNLGATASGENLDPYKTPGFSDAINTMIQDTTNKVKGVYAGSGRDPSGAGSFAGSLGRGITQGVAPAIAGQFNSNVGNMLNANSSLLSGANTTASGITGQNQTKLQDILSAIGAAPSVTGNYLNPGTGQLTAANAAYSQPWTNLAALLQPATALGSLGSESHGSGTSTTSNSTSLLSNILGGAMGGAGILGSLGGSGGGIGALSSLMALSDERAKDDIEPIGKLDDGQDVVRFKYKGEDRTHIGLIAQDVMKFEPRAVRKLDVGLLAIDPKMATDRAAAIRKAA